MGAWIETCWLDYLLYEIGVAPHVGAWIETEIFAQNDKDELSLPTWERGLKHQKSLLNKHQRYVAPHVGAWIETRSRPVWP